MYIFMYDICSTENIYKYIQISMHNAYFVGIKFLVCGIRRSPAATNEMGVEAALEKKIFFSQLKTEINEINVQVKSNCVPTI